MTREEQLDWLYRLRSEIYVYMPKEWIIPMNNALDMTIKALEQEPCEDAISREDVDNALYEYWHDINIVDDSGYFIYKDSMDIINKLPSVYPKAKVGKWIPVSERLPKVEEKVLCQCRANIYEVLKLTVNGWYHDNNHCYMLEFVMAWMPLPKPYKAESSETKQGLAYADQDTMMPAT